MSDYTKQVQTAKRTIMHAIDTRNIPEPIAQGIEDLLDLIDDQTGFIVHDAGDFGYICGEDDRCFYRDRSQAEIDGGLTPGLPAMCHPTCGAWHDRRVAAPGTKWWKRNG